MIKPCDKGFIENGNRFLAITASHHTRYAV
jgi:hypothetical protein